MRRRAHLHSDALSGAYSYTDDEFVTDVRAIFKIVLLFYPKYSLLAEAARTMARWFEHLLRSSRLASFAAAEEGEGEDEHNGGMSGEEEIELFEYADATYSYEAANASRFGLVCRACGSGSSSGSGSVQTVPGVTAELNNLSVVLLLLLDSEVDQVSYS